MGEGVSYGVRWLSLMVFAGACSGDAPGQAGAGGKTFRLTCESWFRPDLTQPPGQRKKISLKIVLPNGPVPEIAMPWDEVKTKHPDFIVVMSNDRGSVLLDVMDAKTKKPLQRFLWQFSQVPRNTFGDQGITGLLYYTHPETGSEMQMICRVNTVKGGAQ